jgi:selenium-binding protein 1
MPSWKPDPTFYPSPRSAAEAPAEELAYVVTLDPQRERPDALVTVDLNSASSTYGQVTGDRGRRPREADRL